MNMMEAACLLCGSECTTPLYKKRDFTVFFCSSCTLAFVWPQISENDSRKLYGESYYESWGMRDDESVYEMKKRTFSLRLRGLERIISPGRILDVGCATGFFLEAAMGRGWDAYGLEINPFALKVARERFGSRIVEGAIEQAHFDNAHFDTIAMSDVLEHMPDPLLTLRRANELLKPGGLIAITTPNIKSITARLLRGKWPHIKLEHQFYFSPGSLSQLLEKAGFQVLSLRSAPKALSLNYIHAQRDVSRVPLLTPAASFLHRWLPDALRKMPFYFLAGEMFAIAKKDDGAKPA